MSRVTHRVLTQEDIQKVHDTTGRWRQTRTIAKTLVVTLGLCLGMGAGTPVRAGNHDQIRASMVLKVRSAEEAADALVKAAEEAGGYFTSRTQEALVMKVPAIKVKAFLDTASGLGIVAEKTYETADLGQQLAETRSKLAAREEVMRKYLDVMNEAGTQGVLRVEQEVTRLVAEIERLKGALRLMEHRIQLSEVTIRFQFRDRSAPVSDGQSSFPWLNTMNLSDLVEDFRYGR